MTDNKRGEYTKGLRALADLLDNNPELILPYDGSNDRYGLLSVIPGDDSAEQLAAWAKALPGLKKKQVSGEYLYLTGALHGLHLQVIGQRDQVCRRVVTGTREVTRTVPDPNAPTVTVTETVEDIEWVCEPILDGARESRAEMRSLAEQDEFYRTHDRTRECTS
jgi:hypothetical protein